MVSIAMHLALHGIHTYKNVYCLVHHLRHWLLLLFGFSNACFVKADLYFLEC